jgi:SRSO17 transposase
MGIKPTTYILCRLCRTMAFHTKQMLSKSKAKIEVRIGTRMGTFKPHASGRHSSSNRGLFQIGKVVKEVDSFLSPFKIHWGSDDGHKWSRNDDTKRAARNYSIGLLLPGRRKNMTGIANRLNIDNNAVQQFISDSPWDCRSVISTNMNGMRDLLTTNEGVIVFDDTGQVKKGTKSPGVARQYSGTIGKVGNCQVIVTSVYTIPGKTHNANAIYWPMNMNMYLPEKWFEGGQRLKEAGIPPDTVFKTKPQIALEQMDIIRKEKIPHCAIIADAGYGTNGDFRKELRGMKEPYALAVTPSKISVVPEETRILPPGQKGLRGKKTKQPTFPEGIIPVTAETISADIRDEEWTTIDWNEGTKGRLFADFVRKRVRITDTGKPTDETGWLIIERTNDQQIKAHICWGLDNHSLEELVKIIHLRWTVEQCFAQMKGEVGMTDFEGRKWRGWHHHAAMTILAFCFLCLLRVLESDSSEPFPTLPQLRREFLRVYTQRFLEIRLKISPEEAASVLEDLPFLIPE